MNESDKNLLLKDLCARLPYGLILNTPTGDKHLLAITTSFEYKTLIVWEDYCGNEHNINEWLGGDVEFVKPYLRPMSSMTEEEEVEYDATFDTIKLDNGHLDSVFTYKSLDYLNAHHFDYRDLIPMGIAIEAVEGMYD